MEHKIEHLPFFEASDSARTTNTANMPHATEDESQYGEVDEALVMQQFLAMGNNGQGGGDGEEDNYQLEPGEKDENAENFSDISDDDLPEEEEAADGRQDGHDLNLSFDDDSMFNPLRRALNGENATNGYHQDAVMEDAKPRGDGMGLFGDDEVNDLFGDGMSSSPVDERKPEFMQQHEHPQPARSGVLALPGKPSGLALPQPGAARPRAPAQSQASPASMSPSSLAGDALSPAASSTMDDDEQDELEDEDPQTRMQRELFAVSKRREAGEKTLSYDVAGLAMDQSRTRVWFPSWEPDEVPKFTDLFRPLPGVHRGKVPQKPPKPVQPTKLSLDMMPDQERSFKTATIAGKIIQDGYQGRSLIKCDHGVAAQDESDDDLALSNFDESEVIGGVTMQDLAVICENWDIPSLDTGSIKAEEDDSDVDMDGEYEQQESMRPAKKRRTGVLDHDASLAMQDAYLRFEDPEHAAARVARAVTLDMNDPYLLLDEQALQTKRTGKHGFGDIAHDAEATRDIARRYNVSNDEAYDLLKENHQHKIRSTLGSMATEHAMPAIKLQWPFYKVGLDAQQKRAFHRQPLTLHETFGRTYKFMRPKFQKRKHTRGREAKDLFNKAEDLTVGDNSSVLMLEYSEEAPIVLSNFGMGNRLINFYRKRDADDQERPKREIGETHVLLNQDKSPFNNFGHVDPGETVPTLQNGMYRAPVFQHTPKSSDFIIGISHTFEGGNRLHLRNVENLHTVGQQFPISEVPGEHSRKVTDAAKKRLKAISYRIYQKTIDPTRRGISLTNKVLMKHIPGSDIPQTRSKMREFMKYEKKAKNSDDDGYWVPMPGDVVPDAETIRSWIKPEDICLLDSMQVGVQHLADLGIQDSKDAKEDDEAEDEENIEKMMAPWRTTKNFIQACQGKAMLKVHGEGDPTGAGQAFSMLKTNMKGGYVPRGESANDKMNQRSAQAASGHKYNVAQQQAKYDRDIRETWNLQKQSLSNEMEMSDNDMEDEEPESAFPYGRGGTPRTSFGTPAGFDDSASQFSKHSVDRSEEVMIIKRKTRDAYGNPVEIPVRIDNPKVIKLYRKKAKERRLARMKSAFIPPHISRRAFLLTWCTATRSSSPPATKSTTNSSSKRFCRRSRVSSATRIAVSLVRSSRRAIWPLPPLPRVLRTLPVPRLPRNSAKALPALGLTTTRRRRRARVARRMARRGSARIVAKWVISRRTGSQYLPLSLSSFVIARSPISGRRRRR